MSFYKASADAGFLQCFCGHRHFEELSTHTEIATHRGVPLKDCRHCFTLYICKKCGRVQTFSNRLQKQAEYVPTPMDQLLETFSPPETK